MQPCAFKITAPDTGEYEASSVGLSEFENIWSKSREKLK